MTVKALHVVVPASVGAIFLILLMVVPASAASISYQTFLPPFHTARTSETASQRWPGANIDSQTISRSGNYSASQNSSTPQTHQYGTANQVTRGWFYSGAYVLNASTTKIHVNSSGTGMGMAQIAVGCTGARGSASAKLNYSLQLGLWDRTTSRWIGKTIFLVDSLNLTVTCLHVGSTTMSKNLTTTWSMGLNPSPMGVSTTDQLQIVTVFVVHTQVASKVHGWAFSYAQIAVHLQRMQGYHY